MNECTTLNLVKLSILVDEECKRKLWACKETKSGAWMIPIRILDFILDRYNIDLSKGEIMRMKLGSIYGNKGKASIKKPLVYISETCGRNK